MARVFISYSRRNKRLAEKLAARLRAAGHYPWIDSADILVGQSIAENIQRAIDACEFICFLVTGHSLKSSWAPVEVSAALNREFGSKSIKVLPLLADKAIKAQALPPFLADKKVADFRNSFDQGFAQLQQAIEAGRGDSWTSRLDVTFYLRDLLPTAIRIINDRFPDYRVVGIRDRDDATRDWLGCSGSPGNCDIEWLFDLEKSASQATGLPRLTAHLHPVWEIVMQQFPNLDEMMLWSTEKVKDDVREKVTQIVVPNIECTALDAEVILFNVEGV